MKGQGYLIGLMIGFLNLYVAGQTVAQSQWLVRDKKPSTEGQWTLYDDGSVTRGDPKTNFDQRENEGHRNIPSKGAKLDLTGWSIVSQGNGPSTSYQVTYLSPTKNTQSALDQVVVTYDLVKGKPLSAVRHLTTEVTVKPDLGDLTSVWSQRFIKADGTGVELYTNKDKTKQATLFYDASGNLVKARVSSQETLSLKDVKVPRYYTQLYGWTKGT